MKVYTKTGDAGSAQLPTGMRLSKGDIRFEALGTLDGLNSLVGWCRSDAGSPERLRADLSWVQDRIMTLCSQLAVLAGGLEEIAVRHPCRDWPRRTLLAWRPRLTRSMSRCRSPSRSWCRGAVRLPAGCTWREPVAAAERYTVLPGGFRPGSTRRSIFPEPSKRRPVYLGTVRESPRRSAERALGPAAMIKIKGI